MLHGLPVQQRIDYKVALLTPEVHNTSTPAYFRRLIQDRQHCHNMQSATTTLCQPSTTTTLAKREFRCSAPAVWNSLPKTVLSSDSVTVFKSRLDTFLFFRALVLSSARQHAAWPQRPLSYDLMPLYKSVYHYYITLHYIRVI